MTEISSALVEAPAPASAPAGKEPSAAPSDTPFVDALAALLGGVPLAGDVPVAAAAAAAAAAPGAAAGSAEPEPVGGRVLSPGEASREQARGIVLTRATRPIGVPADATGLPLRPPVPGAESALAEATAAPSPSWSFGPGAAAVEGRGEGSGTASPVALARATRLADVLLAATPAAPVEQAATPAPATVAGAAGRASGEAAGRASAQAAMSATPAAPGVAPAAPATPSVAAPADASAETALPGRAVGLEHAVETVRLALRHGAERGVTHARISLTPRELGSIEVHLRQTADGLVARVVAEHGAAAQQLQQAGAELRRSLEQQGLTLLRLDIGASGEEASRRAAAFETSAAFGDRQRRNRRDGDDPIGSLGDAADAAAGETTTTLQLPNGALVDVLA